MTYIWIIHTGERGNIHESVILKSKHKSKIGGYIRDNLEQFFFMFRKLGVCNDYGKIKKDLINLYDQHNKFDFYNEKHENKIIKEIRKVLENYTDEQIVDELYGSSSDTERDYAVITKINTNEIVSL